MKTQEPVPTHPTPTHTTVLEDPTELPARERWRRAFQALGQVFADPEKTDQVLVFSTYANAGSMKSRIHRFVDDPRGRRLFDEHRTIDAHSVDLEALGRLPEGTLGRAYADFLRSRGLSPDVFENPPEEVRDPVMAYVIMRLRQTHDLWHVVTGYDTDPASEVALQAFTFAQLGAPSSGILALLGTARGMSLKPTLAVDVAKAYRLGRRAERLAIFPWEDHWSRPLSDVRTLLKLPTIPRDAERLGREVRAALAALATPPTSATAATAAPTTTTSGPKPDATTSGEAGDATTSGEAVDATTSGEAVDATTSGEAVDATSERGDHQVESTTASETAKGFIALAHDTASARARHARRAARRAFRAARRAAA